MQNKSCVYWIHLPEHTDIFSQGYVGVSMYGAEHRYRKHLQCAQKGSKLHVHAAIRKHGDALVVDTVLLADINYCYEMEKKLRPTVNIGYNHDAGGNCNRLGAKLSDETKAKMRDNALANGRKPNQAALDNSAKTNSKKVAWLCEFANKVVWKLAGEVYSYLQINPTHGTNKTSRKFGTTPDQLSTMFKKFKSGWNPLEDTEWLIFSSKLTPDASGDKSLEPA